MECVICQELFSGSIPYVRTAPFEPESGYGKIGFAQSIRNTERAKPAMRITAEQYSFAANVRTQKKPAVRGRLRFTAGLGYSVRICARCGRFPATDSRQASVRTRQAAHRAVHRRHFRRLKHWFLPRARSFCEAAWKY